MTQEEKSLLLQDLCARLPYGIEADCVGEYVKIKYIDPHRGMAYISSLGRTKWESIEVIKPYFRPMSSMTEEEKNNLQSLHDIISDENYEDGYSPSAWNAITEWEDYCNVRHLDYRGLIEKGLALEASEGMYEY